MSFLCPPHLKPRQVVAVIVFVQKLRDVTKGNCFGSADLCIF